MGDGGELSAEQFLERFGFPRGMLAQTLSRLSGGELRRLLLVRLLIAVAQAAENNGCCMLCGEASDPRCDEKLTASLVALHAHLEKG